MSALQELDLSDTSESPTLSTEEILKLSRLTHLRELRARHTLASYSPGYKGMFNI
jgi:hypothetical protein